MNCFYVYEHWRLDLGVCFYVGKGQGSRAFNLRRKGHHGNILRKLERCAVGLDVRFVATDLLESQAFALERERIAFWRATGVELANLTDGGDGLSNPAPATRAKMSAALVGNKRSLGRKHTDTARAKMRAALASPETRAKLVAARAGKTPALGVRFTDEAKARLSAVHKGRKHSEETRQKIRVAKQNMGPETRAKIAAAQKGKPKPEAEQLRLRTVNKGRRHSDETRAAMSAARRGRPRPASFVAKMTGRRNSEETRARMSEAAKAREERSRALKALALAPIEN